jgi:hypothetical protein
MPSTSDRDAIFLCGLVTFVASALAVGVPLSRVMEIYFAN